MAMTITSNLIYHIKPVMTVSSCHINYYLISFPVTTILIEPYQQKPAANGKARTSQLTYMYID